MSPLHDPVSGGIPEGVQLVLPVTYILISPLSRVFDMLGLLSIGQDVAVGLTVIVVSFLTAAVWERGGRGRRIWRPISVAGVSLGVLVAVYACGATLPRPMASLTVNDPNVLRVDFHSHTNASKDARVGFSPEENRAWHHAGGFDVAYVSDHRTFVGAKEGLRRNPARAGESTVLLSALEGRYLGTFEIFLSVTEADSAALINAHQHLVEGKLSSGRVPVSVVALPSPLVDVQSLARDGPPHIAAIEIVDGSPRGFTQRDRDGKLIMRRADSLGIALVAGSNNHGWDRVVSAWTLIVIPGWRALTPDSLAAVIENTLRTSPRTAVRVVERRRPGLITPIGLTLTVPVIFAQLLAELTIRERIVWLLWIWAAAFIWYSLRSRRSIATLR
jgi:hypothetical protein